MLVVAADLAHPLVELVVEEQVHLVMLLGELLYRQLRANPIQVVVEVAGDMVLQAEQVLVVVQAS